MLPNALPRSGTSTPPIASPSPSARVTPPGSPTAREPSPSNSTLRDTLVQAAALTDAKKPREALDLLKAKASHAAAQSNAEFQWHLGNAYLNVADELTASNRLGAFLVAPDATGNWLKFTVQAEILSCYVGVLSSLGRFRSLLQDPDQCAQYAERRGDGGLQLALVNVTCSMDHARRETFTFFNKISQVNQNLATQEFVQKCLQAGTNLNMVSADQPFRQIETDPLYQPIADATAPVRQALQELPKAPLFFWHNWVQNSLQEFYNLPELQVANTFMQPWPILPTYNF